MLEVIKGLVSERSAADCYVVQQAAWPTIRSMHRTEESPALWQKFPHSGCLHLGEVGSAVYGPEVRQKPHVVELVCNDAKSFVLHEI